MYLVMRNTVQGSGELAYSQLHTGSILTFSVNLLHPAPMLVVPALGVSCKATLDLRNSQSQRVPARCLTLYAEELEPRKASRDSQIEAKRLQGTRTRTMASHSLYTLKCFVSHTHRQAWFAKYFQTVAYPPRK